MATIDWEERVFQLASSLYASNFDEMDAESAIANALHFKEKYIEKMGLDEPKKEKKSKAKDSWRGFKSETKKIVWPTWKQVLKGTGVVLVVVIICAVAIGALDLTFSKGMDALINLFKK